MITKESITGLRMERQFLARPANEEEYRLLYRDTQPVQNVYWRGFGDPPSMAFRADFDDLEWNRGRQRTRELVKGRFQGGNLGWIDKRDMELFACMCRKESALRPADAALLDLIEREGPMNIQQMKEAAGMLVKEITPALHRLQEAFLVYEDQYNGEWDREWYRFAEIFPEVNFQRYSRVEALQIVLPRFAKRMVWFDVDMAKSFYRLPGKEIRAAAAALSADGTFIPFGTGFLLRQDAVRLEEREYEAPASVYALHRNDILVKSNEHWLKARYKHAEYDILQYLLIDGEFHGAVLGHFKNGPYIIEDVALDLAGESAAQRKPDIMEAVYRVNSREHSPIRRYLGESL